MLQNNENIAFQTWKIGTLLILLRGSIMRQYYTPLYSHFRRLYSALIFRVYICAFLVTRLYP